MIMNNDHNFFYASFFLCLHIFKIFIKNSISKKRKESIKQPIKHFV